MNVYKINRTDKYSYDYFDGAVVVAKDVKSAAKIHPNGYAVVGDSGTGGWCSLDKVKVELVGAAVASLESGMILCSSYNRG